MPSHALTDSLQALFADVTELLEAHNDLSTGRRGRQWDLGALNRATVVLAVSAWEAYVEGVVMESRELLRPSSGTPLGSWPALKVQAQSLIGRFNTPNAQNVRNLLRNSIGMPDIAMHWCWRNCDPAKAIRHHDKALRVRHQIAHGVNPRPPVHNTYARYVREFFGRLGEKTDSGITDHMANALGVRTGW